MAAPDLPGIRPAPAWLTDMGNPAAIKAIADALPFGTVAAAPQQPPVTVPGGGASSLAGGGGNSTLAGGGGNSTVASPAPPPGAPPAPHDTLAGADCL
jgi:hypothetical protein